MKLGPLESKKDNVLRFSIKDSSIKFANLLRRTIISQVPVLAIETVTFYENSGTIFDEYISHRIGLVPLTTPEKLKEEEYVFVLDVKGPKKVYSGDLKPVEHEIKPAIDNIPIITLLEDQSLRLEAKAVLGIGKTHAKFQPGFAFYSYDDKTGEIEFKVESFHQMDPKTLVVRALKLIEHNLGTLEKEIEKIK